MNRSQYFGTLLAAALLQGAISVAAETRSLTLADAITLAQAHDAWTEGSLLQQRALEANSISSGSLPDPQFSAGFANLPVDSFDFNQEAMTQFKVGVSQSFPRGHSRSLQRQRLELLSEQQPLLRQDRQARVALQVSALWLDAYLAQESIRLIDADRSLFEYLVDVAQATYSSGVGSSRAQNVIRAQLELTRLDDRLAMLQQNYDSATSRLGEWLANAYPSADQLDWLTATRVPGFVLAVGMPEVAVPALARLSTPGPLDSDWVVSRLLQHPAILAYDKDIDAEQMDVRIAEQNYKPMWGVNASYGFRENGPDGVSRDDFFSIGVTFDLPLFAANRQDQTLKASIAESEAVKTRKWLALRSMSAQLEAARANLIRLDQRRSLYQQQLLQQMHDQAEAALSAYTTDDGDFAEAVRARIAELNAKVEALDIEINRCKTLTELNYYLVGDTGVQRESQGD